MKKLLVVFLLLLFPLVLTGCNGSGQQTNLQDNQENQQVEESMAPTENEGYSGKLEKIISLGQALECSFKQSDQYYGSSWIKGENSYSEIYAEGKKSHIIVKDDCVWTWGEESDGVKICFNSEIKEEATEEVEQEIEEKEASETEEMGPPSDVEYDCRPAVFGEEKFSPPDNVAFTDLDQMLPEQMLEEMMPEDLPEDFNLF